MAQRSHLPSDANLAAEAETALIQRLAAETQERLKVKQQLTLVAGGSIAVVATLGNTLPSAVARWLYLGLSLLFLAFGFAMLDQDRVIAVAATFVAQKLDGPHAMVDHEWTSYLNSEEAFTWGPGGISMTLRKMGMYAIPFLGTVGASCVFVAVSEGLLRLLVLIPAALMGLFLYDANDTGARYSRLRR